MTWQRRAPDGCSYRSLVPNNMQVDVAWATARRDGYDAPEWFE
jgi:hypothetical protein